MEKKKVLFFIYQLGAGGAGRTLLNVINHIDRTQFEPILVTLNYEGSYEAYLQDDIRFIKLDTKRLRSAIFPLAKVIRQERPDLIFSTIPNYNLIAIMARLCSFTKAKNIVREAALLGEEDSANLKLVIYGMFYRLASHVISLSEGVKVNLVERYNVNPTQITVIYNPIDLKNLTHEAETGLMPATHEQLFQTDAKTIVTAGRLVKDKDQQTLIKAFSIVNQKLPSELIILGVGEEEETLRALTRKLDIEQSVHFIGFQKNPYMYFKRADLFALSSLREGFGHVLVEALATGTPVVSTNCKPGAEEVLANGKYGTICEVGNSQDMADAMYEVLTLSPQETTERIEKGLQRANEFAAQTIVNQYESTFSQVIDPSKRQNVRR